MKKIIAVLLSALLILTVFSACGKNNNSQESSVTEYQYTHRELEESTYTEAAVGFSGGDGSEKSPFEISSAAELALLSELINDPEKSLNNEYDKAYYVLTNDIQLNDTADFDSWSEKAPEYSWKTIDGIGIELVFDGAGHTISGLYINADNTESKSEYGLFGTFNGTIKNLNLDKAYISVSGKSSYIGALAGYLMQDGKIENCKVNATVDCYDNDAGGIVGYAAGGFVTENLVETDEIKFPVINNCSFEGKINQVKEESHNTLGGIVAAGSCEIIDCTNNGSIDFVDKEIDKAGGIIAMSGFGNISGCVNNGEIKGSISEEGNFAVVAGGIIGSAFQSATGTKHMSRGLTIENCVNNAKISAHTVAGGIAGSAANDNNEWCLTFKGCTNNGAVESSDYCGGIVGELTCEGENVNGDNIVIDSCVNTADVGNTTSGGIVGSFLVSTGDVVIKNCKNSGNITSTESQDAGGIIGYWLAMKEVDTRISVKNCENSGKVEATLNAGGIVGMADNTASLKTSASSAVNITDCKNSGEIISHNYNGFIGGIAGNWGMKGLKTSFVGCENSGKLTLMDNEFDKNTLESETTFTLSRIVGGIVGRVGSGLLLTTDNDKVNEKNINSKNAVITFENCSNTGSYSVADTEKYEFENGEAVYENYFGGIIGNSCAENDFSIMVKDCTYKNFERGLGNEDLPDVGEEIISGTLVTPKFP